MQRRLGRDINYADEWLREFIGSSSNGLFIITTREYVKWADTEPEWDKYLDQHILGSLSDKDADYFLSSVPIEDQKIKKAIIDTAKGLPLYLDLCVSIYVGSIERGANVTESDLIMAHEKVIACFLGHLTPNERAATEILSLLHYFDEDLFRGLMKEFNIGFPINWFSEFTDASFISEIDEHMRFFKVHDSMREHIRQTTDQNIKSDLAKATLKHFSARSNTLEHARLRMHFSQCVGLLIEYGGEDTEDIERILDIGFRMINNGFWLDVFHTLGAYETANLRARSSVRAVMDLLYGVVLRRFGKLLEAKTRLSRLEPFCSTLGRYQRLARFNRANIDRLLGHYDIAQREYEQLASGLESNPEDHAHYVKVLRQLADIYFLRGQFSHAVEILQRLLASSLYGDLERAENLRILGHIYRFNFYLAKAELLYNQSLAIAEKLSSIGLIGKLYTNLAETLCWVNPRKAIAIGEKALHHNGDLESQIEVGKTRAALAIAHALEGSNLQKAYYNARTAAIVQTEVGYRSGILFAKLAEAIACMVTGRRNAVIRLIRTIEETIADLGVYRFIQLPLLVYLKDEIMIRSLEQGIEWLDFNATRAQCEQVIHRAIPG